MPFIAARMSFKARPRTEEKPTVTCSRLALALGSAFLKRSSATSSLRGLVVSARAASSSER
eukprot:12409629-Heterocapsa_arctica.AAC.1